LTPTRRYLFGLAERLKMTVTELERRMSGAELAEWWKYDRWVAAEREKERRKAERRRR